MPALVWFKKDLRIIDNPALFHACQHSEDGIVAVYVIDPEMWKKHGISHCQIEFILRGLQVLSEELEKINISLVIIHADSTKQIPTLLLNLIKELKITKLFFNREYEVNESIRDQAVIDLLERNQIPAKIYEDQLILPYQLIQTNQGSYFKVFTAFKRQWLKIFMQTWPKALAKPKKQSKLAVQPTPVPTHLPTIQSSIDADLWPAGANVAQKKLQYFIQKEIFLYDQQRDFPYLDKTSKLSPYLAVGMISARECFLAALAANAGELDTGNPGALTWMSELIWREFYRHILIHVPHVCKNLAYNLKTDKLPWNYNEKLLKAWQDGQTGFPLVDAAMRQLNTIGWMHNRLRMVVAMFLSKNLFLDWRLGERYFTEKLIDIDFASNNGGWQWSASTGTDAVPYFRIFNPITQSIRFDSEGEFIKTFCPELKNLDKKKIHDPFAQGVIDLAYPHPVIDYKASRASTIKAFKDLDLA